MEALYGHRYDPVGEITVTAGATQAIITAVLAFVGPGDEVIVLDPCYDSYAPNIELAGGARGPRAAAAGDVPARLRRASPPRSARRPRRSSSTRRTTRAARSGPPTTWRAWPSCCGRPTSSSSATRSTSTWSTTATHPSAARFPELAARTVVVSSFGKTYHVTGWKVGYAAAPAPLMAEFRKVHQFNVFTVNTPMQHGLGDLPRRSVAPPRPAGVLPRQARSVPCRAGGDAAAPPAVPGHVLPVRRLLGRQRPRRRRVLPLADERDRRRRHSALRVLRRRLRPEDRPLLLRQEGRDARSRPGAPALLARL